MSLLFYAKCYVTKQVGTDLYGQATMGSTVQESCAIVRLRRESMHTTVRTDSSASRGHGDEAHANVLLLLEPTTTARIDDKLTVSNISIRIKDLHERYDVFGVLDHYECRGELWE